MPNTASAKKHLRTDRERQLRNRIRKSRIRTAEKRLLACIAAGDAEGAEQMFRRCCSELDRAANANTIHKRTASRKKGRLAAKTATLAAPAEAEEDA